MKRYSTLVEGIVLGIAGLVIGILGWADDNLKWILLFLSPAVIIASVALFVFQYNRDKSGETAE